MLSLSGFFRFVPEKSIPVTILLHIDLMTETNEDTCQFPLHVTRQSVLLSPQEVESLLRTCCLALNHVLLCQVAKGKDAAVYDLRWLVCWQSAPVQESAL